MNAQLLTADDLALRPGRGQRSPWLRETLAEEGASLDGAGEGSPPLDDDGVVDVLIVGGGYTGLWTALQLHERDPRLRVAILEQDICGGGPSGRNGGFVNGWWDELAALVDLFGAEGALNAAREVGASVAEIGAWCERHAVEARYRRGGMLTVSTTAFHDRRLLPGVAAAAELGVPDALRSLTAADVAERCRSPRFRGASLMADGATVDPARLVRGMRRVALAKGVAIHEGTRMTRLGETTTRHVRVTAETRAGTFVVRAGHVVLALNAWSAGWAPFRHRLITWSSYLVRSEPIPGRIADLLGWTGGESIVDARASVHYLHVTDDGRITCGAGAGLPGFGGRIGASFTDDTAAARRAAAAFRWFFPQLADVPLTDAWGGPIDMSADHLPFFGTLRGGRVHYGIGYSGNGVAPSHLGGRILAALCLESDEALTRLPLVRTPRPAFPPEPLRYVGARLLRKAMVEREDGEEAGRPPTWWLRQLSGLPRRLGYRLGPAD